jgi:hypothetical protein
LRKQKTERKKAARDRKRQLFLKAYEDVNAIKVEDLV